MRFLTALIVCLLALPCAAQVTVSDSGERFYAAKSAVVYDMDGTALVKAASLDTKPKGIIDVRVANRENYSTPIGISSIKGILTMRNTVKLEKDYYVLIGNAGEVWTILITVIKDGIAVNEFSEPITIPGEPEPPPDPQPDDSLSDLAKKIADIAKGMTAKDRESVSRLYDSVANKIDSGEFTSVAQVSSYISNYQLSIENQAAFESFKTFLRADVPSRNLDLKGFRDYCVEIVKGIKSVSPDIQPDSTSPFTETGLRVAIVYETEQVTQYARGHLEQFASVDLFNWIGSMVVKDNQGHPEFRFFDPNDVPTGVWSKPMSLPRQSLPWIYVGNGKTGFSGPLPATAEETKALISKYAG